MWPLALWDSAELSALKEEVQGIIKWLHYSDSAVLIVGGILLRSKWHKTVVLNKKIVMLLPVFG